MIRAIGFLILLALLGLFMTGCVSSGVELTPQQRVEAAAVRYAQLTSAANTYAQLPFCDHAEPPCAQRRVVIWMADTLPYLRGQLDAARESAKAGEYDPLIEQNVTALLGMLNRRMAE